MKIKKFKNLWTMGIILFSLILITLYLLKLIVPEFVIKIAEIDAVVKFGNYIDSHQWAYYLFNFIVSLFTYYFFCCACCRKHKLRLIDISIISIINIILFIIQRYMSEFYVYFNVISLILCPALICLIDKRTEIKYFYSTCIVFTIHLIAQIISLSIREISTLISFPNSATFTLLVIDGFIWLVLLYNYYNFKETK